MKSWIIERWDWWIYHRAFHTLRRMCERNQGFALLMELWLAEWRSEHPISESLEKSTQAFFRSQLEFKKNRAEIERRLQEPTVDAPTTGESDE